MRVEGNSYFRVVDAFLTQKAMNKEMKIAQFLLSLAQLNMPFLLTPPQLLLMQFQQHTLRHLVTKVCRRSLNIAVIPS